MLHENLQYMSSIRSTKVIPHLAIDSERLLGPLSDILIIFSDAFYKKLNNFTNFLSMSTDYFISPLRD